MRTLAIVALILAYLALVTVSNVGLKLSAGSSGWRGFLQWQAVGNLSGFLAVLALTFLLRFISLHLAYAYTAGLGFVSVQVIGARLIFQEAITPGQWLGMAFIAGGMMLVSLAR